MPRGSRAGSSHSGSIRPSSSGNLSTGENEDASPVATPNFRSTHTDGWMHLSKAALANLTAVELVLINNQNHLSNRIDHLLEMVSNQAIAHDHGNNESSRPARDRRGHRSSVSSRASSSHSNPKLGVGRVARSDAAVISAILEYEGDLFKVFNDWVRENGRWKPLMTQTKSVADATEAFIADCHGSLDAIPFDTEGQDDLPGTLLGLINRLNTESQTKLYNKLSIRHRDEHKKGKQPAQEPADSMEVDHEESQQLPSLLPETDSEIPETVSGKRVVTVGSDGLTVVHRSSSVLPAQRHADDGEASVASARPRKQQRLNLVVADSDDEE